MSENKCERNDYFIDENGTIDSTRLLQNGRKIDLLFSEKEKIQKKTNHNKKQKNKKMTKNSFRNSEAAPELATSVFEMKGIPNGVEFEFSYDVDGAVNKSLISNSIKTLNKEEKLDSVLDSLDFSKTPVNKVQKLNSRLANSGEKSLGLLNGVQTVEERFIYLDKGSNFRWSKKIYLSSIIVKVLMLIITFIFFGFSMYKVSAQNCNITFTGVSHGSQEFLINITNCNGFAYEGPYDIPLRVIKIVGTSDTSSFGSQFTISSRFHLEQFFDSVAIALVSYCLAEIAEVKNELHQFESFCQEKFIAIAAAFQIVQTQINQLQLLTDAKLGFTSERISILEVKAILDYVNDKIVPVLLLSSALQNFPNSSYVLPANFNLPPFTPTTLYGYAFVGGGPACVVYTSDCMTVMVVFYIRTQVLSNFWIDYYNLYRVEVPCISSICNGCSAFQVYSSWVRTYFFSFNPILLYSSTDFVTFNDYITQSGYSSLLVTLLTVYSPPMKIPLTGGTTRACASFTFSYDGVYYGLNSAIHLPVTTPSASPALGLYEWNGNWNPTTSQFTSLVTSREYAYIYKLFKLQTGFYTSNGAILKEPDFLEEYIGPNGTSIDQVDFLIYSVANCRDLGILTCDTYSQNLNEIIWDGSCYSVNCMINRENWIWNGTYYTSPRFLYTIQTTYNSSSNLCSVLDDCNGGPCVFSSPKCCSKDYGFVCKVKVEASESSLTIASSVNISLVYQEILSFGAVLDNLTVVSTVLTDMQNEQRNLSKEIDTISQNFTYVSGQLNILSSLVSELTDVAQSALKGAATAISDVSSGIFGWTTSTAYQLGELIFIVLITVVVIWLLIKFVPVLITHKKRKQFVTTTYNNKGASRENVNKEENKYSSVKDAKEDESAKSAIYSAQKMDISKERKLYYHTMDEYFNFLVFELKTTVTSVFFFIFYLIGFFVLSIYSCIHSIFCPNKGKEKIVKYDNAGKGNSVGQIGEQDEVKVVEIELAEGKIVSTNAEGQPGQKDSKKELELGERYFYLGSEVNVQFFLERANQLPFFVSYILLSLDKISLRNKKEIRLETGTFTNEIKDLDMEPDYNNNRGYTEMWCIKLVPDSDRSVYVVDESKENLILVQYLKSGPLTDFFLFISPTAFLRSSSLDTKDAVVVSKILTIISQACSIGMDLDWTKVEKTIQMFKKYKTTGQLYRALAVNAVNSNYGSRLLYTWMMGFLFSSMFSRKGDLIIDLKLFREPFIENDDIWLVSILHKDSAIETRNADIPVIRIESKKSELLKNRLYLLNSTISRNVRAQVEEKNSAVFYSTLRVEKNLLI
jgi:hypothetical protein